MVNPKRPTPPRGPVTPGGTIPRRRNFQSPSGPDYLSPDWLVLWATYLLMALIFFLFTPYTHQLDEIKNTLLFSFTPFLLIGALYCVRYFNDFTWKRSAATILLALFTVNMLFSWVINPYRLVAERVVWFQVACATFTVIFAWLMDSEDKLRKTMMFIVLLSFGSVIIGLFMFAGQNWTQVLYEHGKAAGWSSDWNTLFYTLASSKEMYSTILNTDFYAAYLVMTIPITLAMFFVEEHIGFKILAIVTFLLMNICLVFTNSNDSLFAVPIICYPVFFLLGFFYLKNWNLSVKHLITFFVGGAVVALTAFLLMAPKLATTWEFKSAALEGRKVLWSGGLLPWLYGNDLSRTHWDWISILFGRGPGGYRFYFPLFRRADFFDNQINNVTTFGHNYYFDILLEFGAIGLLLFFAFYGTVLWGAFQQIRKTENRTARLYQMAMIAGLMAIAFQNFFSPNNRWAVCGMVFWAMFGFSMGIKKIDQPAEAPELSDNALQTRKVFWWVTLVFACFFMFQSTPQGFLWWTAAKDNGLGLKYMDGSEGYSGTDKQKLLMMAQRYFESAIQENPTFVTTYYKLAHVYNTLGNEDQAIKTYEKLEEINPHYSEIHLNLGIMYWSKALAAADKKEQLKYMEKAYTQIKEAARQELKPNVQWRAGAIGQELAQMYEQQSQAAEAKGPDGRTEAVKDMEKANAIYTESKGYYRNIITYKPVLEEYRIERKNFYPKAEKELLRIAYLTGKLDEAEQVLEQMYWEDPDKTEYKNGLLTFYDKQKKYDAKIKFLEKAVHANPLDVSLRKQLADTYVQTKDLKGYEDELKRIDVLEPNNKTTLSGLYLAYKTAGKADLASEYAKRLKAIGVNPDSVTTTTALIGGTSLSKDLLAPSAEPMTDDEDEVVTVPMTQPEASGAVPTSASATTGPETATSASR